MLDENFHCKPIFSEPWWKHIPIPPLTSADPFNVPTVVMWRDPYQQMVSLFLYAKLDASELVKAAKFKPFLRTRFPIGKPKTGLLCDFSNPVEYWNQFYFASLAHRRLFPSKFYFQSFDALVRNPTVEMDKVQRSLGLARKACPVDLPDRKMKNGGDEFVRGDQLRKQPFNPGDAFYDLDKYYAAEDRTFVKSRLLDTVVEELNARI